MAFFLSGEGDEAAEDDGMKEGSVVAAITETRSETRVK